MANRNVSRPHSRILLVLAAILPASAAAANPGIFNIGVLPGGVDSVANGVSADGQYVVGWASSPAGPSRAIRWTIAGGMEDLGTLSGGTSSSGSSISADGSVIVGVAGTPAGQRGFRWTSSGMQEIGLPPGATTTQAVAVSNDGSIVAGTSNPSGSRAMRWTFAGGTPVAQDLGVVAGGFSSTSRGISADGSVVVGFGGAATHSSVAFRWTEAGGMQSLGALPGATNSFGWGVSGDGSVVVGESTIGSPRAFRWTEAGGMQDLGLPPGADSATARAANFDGSLVVGAVESLGWSSAFLWTESLGMINLHDYLPGIGIDLTGWHLTEAWGISADGNVIVGYGQYEGSPLRGWVVVIPAPGVSGMLLMAGCSAMRRRRR